MRRLLPARPGHRPPGPMARALALLCLGGSFAVVGLPAAHAQTICWRGDSGVLPDDAVVPDAHRFVTTEGASQITLAQNALRVQDISDPERVVMRKSDIAPIAPDDSWQFDLRIHMPHSQRTGNVQVGNQSVVSDTAHSFHLGVDATGVGFLQDGSNWVNGQFIAMDFTDGFHDLRVVASADTIRLYIDGSSSAAITLAKSSFPPSSGSVFTLVATSIAGTSEFFIEESRLRRFGEGLALSACSPVVAPGDVLLFEAREGKPSTPNLLYLHSIDGAPFLFRILRGGFQADGTWTLPAVVPAGLAGFELGFVLFGFDQASGQLVQTDEAAVAFR